MKKADVNKPAATMYPKSRRAVADCKSVLKQSNNKKLSKDKLPVIKKGKFKGYVIYTLTLEERATCPRYCYHWDNCYGNNMMFGHRIQHGPELEAALQKEVAELCATYRGVIIRLHVLGDFYSVDYVNLWQSLLVNLTIWLFGVLPDTNQIALLVLLFVRFVILWVTDSLSVLVMHRTGNLAQIVPTYSNQSKINR